MALLWKESECTLAVQAAGQSCPDGTSQPSRLPSWRATHSSEGLANMVPSLGDPGLPGGSRWLCACTRWEKLPKFMKHGGPGTWSSGWSTKLHVMLMRAWTGLAKLGHRGIPSRDRTESGGLASPASGFAGGELCFVGRPTDASSGWSTKLHGMLMRAWTGLAKLRHRGIPSRDRTEPGGLASLASSLAGGALCFVGRPTSASSSFASSSVPLEVTEGAAKHGAEQGFSVVRLSKRSRIRDTREKGITPAPLALLPQAPSGGTASSAVARSSRRLPGPLDAKAPS